MSNTPAITRPSEEDTADAIRTAKGLLSQAAKILGVAPSTVTKHVQKSEFLQSVVLEANEKQLDRAEEVLATLIEQGELGAVIFYLKCKGKNRGFVERSEVVVSPGKITIVDDVGSV